jgi:hypothetical protein
VLAPSDGSGVRRPGLLVAWQQSDDGWRGNVVYVAELTPGGWAVVQEWIRSELLTPVTPP